MLRGDFFESRFIDCISIFAMSNDFFASNSDPLAGVFGGVGFEESEIVGRRQGFVHKFTIPYCLKGWGCWGWLCQ